MPASAIPSLAATLLAQWDSRAQWHVSGRIMGVLVG